jgi:hypothetical protein
MNARVNAGTTAHGADPCATPLHAVISWRLSVIKSWVPGADT